MNNFMLKNIFVLMSIFALSACSGGDSGGSGGTTTPPPVSEDQLCLDDNSTNKGSALPCICKVGYKPNVFETSCSLATGNGGIAPSSLFYNKNLFTLTTSVHFVSGVPAVLGCNDDPCTFTSAPALPSGVSLNAQTGLISGSSSLVSARRYYEITATNKNGFVKTAFQLEVIPRPPAFTQLISEYSFNVASSTQTDLKILEKTSGPGSVTSVSISPPLPQGLALSVNYVNSEVESVYIRGKAQVGTPMTEYTITALPAAGFGYANFERTIFISSISPPSSFSYDLTGTTCEELGNVITCDFTFGVPFPRIKATAIGAEGFSVLSGEFPNGVFFSGDNDYSNGTGDIYSIDVGPYESTPSGIPVSVIVQATNSVGSLTKQFLINVSHPQSITSISYNIPAQIRNLSNPGNMNPTFDGVSAENSRPHCHGSVDCYTITPSSLPVGMEFSTQSGIFSVSPYISYHDNQVPSSAFSYEIKVKDTAVKTAVSFSLLRGLPKFDYQSSEMLLTKLQPTGNKSLEINAASIPASHINFNTIPKSFSISPSLPLGLSINSGVWTGPSTENNSGGIISGTPMALQENVVHKVLACNGVNNCIEKDIVVTVNPELKEVAIGKSHGCGIEKTGLEDRILCWGDNSKGQLGYSSVDPSSFGRPVRKSNGEVFSGTFSGLVAGENHTCVKKTNSSDSRQEAFCWGDNSYNQISNSSNLIIANPLEIKRAEAKTCTTFESEQLGCVGQAINSNFKDVYKIAAGAGDTCLVAPGNNIDGSSVGLMVHCLGKNFEQTGLGSKQGVDLYDASKVVEAGDISMGENHICVVDQKNISSNPEELLLEKTLKCFGDNSKGQLGAGVSGGSSVSMVDVVGTEGSLKTQGNVILATGTNHSCSYLNNNLYCWGENLYGKLGVQSQSDYNFAALIGNMSLSSLFLTQDNSYLIERNSSSYVDETSGSQITVIEQILKKAGKDILEPTFNTSFVSLSDVPVIFKSPISANFSEDLVCVHVENELSLEPVFSCKGKNDKGQLATGDLLDKTVLTPMVFKEN